MSLLFDEYAGTIHINDLSRPVYAFWESVLNDTKDMCHKVASVRVTMRESERQREVYDRRADANISDLGFAALFLNRTNRSGIIGGGVISGKDQSGPWGLDARFNKEQLVHRIQRIGHYRSRSGCYQRDALDFITTTLQTLARTRLLF